MDRHGRPPAGPRGIVGAAAEDAAVEHLAALGWTILGRNVRTGADEIDIVAMEPGRAPTLVIVEVRSRSGPRFGSAVESIDARKVTRLYRAAWSLIGGANAAIAPWGRPPAAWRVDLVAMCRAHGAAWSVQAHVRGLGPP